MADCSGLSKFKTYDLGFVKQDEAEGTIAVQIVNPPASCPDGIYITHKGELVVDSHARNSTLVYTSHPTITVRDSSMVQVTNPESHVFAWLFGTAMLAALIYLLYRFIKTINTNTETRNLSTGQWHSSVPTYSHGNGGGGGGTTVVNNNSGNGMVEGLILGSMLNSNHSTNTVIEKTTVIERDHSSDSSSSRDDSYSSDSSSSFGSDSSSSYSSDSGSSFGSDSGSSFGGDSGGSFGSGS